MENPPPARAAEEVDGEVLREVPALVEAAVAERVSASREASRDAVQHPAGQVSTQRASPPACGRLSVHGGVMRPTLAPISAGSLTR